MGNNIIAYNPRYDANAFVSNKGDGIWDPVSKQPVAQFVTIAKRAGISFLRWPGGDESRILDWRLTVGPIGNRPRQQFGLPEFLTFCASVGAQPVITVATSVGNSASAADLVEYLNAPDNGSNPNGGVDWAAVRRADGHKAPWDVVWFEYGNEEFNTPRSVDDYVTNYLAYQTKMKGVDQKIKLGAVLDDSTNVDDGWSVTVLQRAGKQIDFAIVHPYIPKLNKAAVNKFHEQEVMLAAVSADADLIYRLGLYQDLIKRLTGRADLHLAVTEYNGHFVQQDPVPYRQTLVNALHNADFVRVFLNPEFKVLFANFWQFANDYWGMVVGDTSKREALVPQANFYVYELYNNYLGDELVKMDVSGPLFSFKGGMGLSSRIGTASARKSMGIQVLTKPWEQHLFKEGSQTQTGNIVSVDFKQGVNINYYHAYKVIDVEPDTFYKFSVLMRTKDLKGGKIGIAVEDMRGWNQMFHQPFNIIRSGTTPWSWATVEFKTLADAKKIRVMARLIGGAEPLSGHVEFGEVRVEKIKQSFGAVDAVVGTASRNANGDEVNLVLINKNLSDAVDTTIQIEGDYRVVKAETLTGPSPLATNLKPGLMTEQIKIVPLLTEQQKPGFFMVKIPASSVSGIKLKRI
ncbi:MAG: hypothetical protein A2505_02055 [Deltaproteobacteria bacterium RIFOXYD12_FULL_55_16]|nr:MAG: hypothetical protein A2505_02055 [Deltaproteobacteria bacterium RIFOXYD12_FULL_55_16]